MRNLNKELQRKLTLTSDKKSDGDIGEARALKFLRQHNLSLVDKNYRTKMGEIDLIMFDGQQIVFVEVKLRRSARFGFAQEQVTTSKQLKIIKSAQYFLLKHKKWQQFPARFDIVAINQKNATPEWLQGAFQLQ